MTDEDIERLRRSLDLGIHITNHRQVRGKRREADAAARFLVGLFPERGAGEGEWVLEARTWGGPLESAVHEWARRSATS
jgi:hypothetical protein